MRRYAIALRVRRGFGWGGSSLFGFGVDVCWRFGPGGNLICRFAF